jgi:hypothetical protein
MLLALLVALQAAPAEPDSAPPDIALEVRATVREVRIRQRGETSLEVRAQPDGGSRVDVDRPEAGGRTRLRNVEVRVKAEARIDDSAHDPAAQETSRPQ